MSQMELRNETNTTKQTPHQVEQQASDSHTSQYDSPSGDHTDKMLHSLIDDVTMNMTQQIDLVLATITTDKNDTNTPKKTSNTPLCPNKKPCTMPSPDLPTDPMNNNPPPDKANESLLSKNPLASHANLTTTDSNALASMS